MKRRSFLSALVGLACSPMAGFRPKPTVIDITRKSLFVVTGGKWTLVFNGRVQTYANGEVWHGTANWKSEGTE